MSVNLVIEGVCRGGTRCSQRVGPGRLRRSALRTTRSTFFALLAVFAFVPVSSFAAAAPSAIETEVAEVVLPPGPFAGGDIRPGPTVRSRSSLLVVALAPPVLLWLGLALGRSLRDDPFRARRASRRALRRVLGRMRGGDVSPAQLESWRELTTQLWPVGLAVPTADELAASTTDPETWRALWLESEVALFSPRRGLAPDWPARATAALDRVAPLPRLTWLPVRRGHWIPRLAMLTLALALVGVTLHPVTAATAAVTPAADPLSAYRDGKFAEAAAGWSAAAAKRPGDWALHHNAALAHGQLGQWGPASGHWAAAWAVNRDNRVLEAGILTGLAQLDGVDPALRRLLVGRASDRFAGRLPVASWERLGLVAAAALALGLGLAVISLYTPFRPRWWLLSGAAVAVVGAVIGYGSVDAIKRHGVLADPLAAFVTETSDVRAVPSELMTNQQAATLFPGTIVIVDRTFLSWDHVITENGNEGWVRSEALVWLYGARDSDEIATVLRQKPE